MSMKRERVATPLTPAEAAPLFVRAFERYFGRLPTKQEARWLFALAMHENAHGKSIIQHNWGNVMNVDRRVPYWVPPWAEPNAATPDKTAPQRFNAYDSHEEGLQRWFRLLDVDQKGTHQRILAAARADGPGPAFYKAVATPHPVTKMMYCHDCHKAAATLPGTYQSLADKYEPLFESLASVEKKSEEAEAHGELLSLLELGQLSDLLWLFGSTEALQRALKRVTGIDLVPDGIPGPLTREAAERVKIIVQVK